MPTGRIHRVVCVCIARGTPPILFNPICNPQNMQIISCLVSLRVCLYLSSRRGIRLVIDDDAAIQNMPVVVVVVDGCMSDVYTLLSDPPPTTLRIARAPHLVQINASLRYTYIYIYIIYKQRCNGLPRCGGPSACCVAVVMFGYDLI